VSETDGGNRISVLDHRAAFGDSPPLHRHIDDDEIFHIVSRTVRFVVDGKELTIGPGDTMRGPNNIPTRIGSNRAVAPGKQQFEHFVRAIGRRPMREGLPHPSGPPTAQQAEALAEAARKYRIETVGPPLT
jgi:Cupin domain